MANKTTDDHEVSFMDLPAELRLKIYEHAMPARIELLIRSKYKEHHGNFFAILQAYGHESEQASECHRPGFIFANKLILRETISLFWERTTLHPARVRPLQCNIMFDDKQAKLIQNLRVVCNSYPKWYRKVDIGLNSCPNIKKIEISIPASQLGVDLRAPMPHFPTSLGPSYTPVMSLAALLRTKCAGILKNNGNPANTYGFSALCNLFHVTVMTEYYMRIHVRVLEREIGNAYADVTAHLTIRYVVNENLMEISKIGPMNLDVHADFEIARDDMETRKELRTAAENWHGWTHLHASPLSGLCLLEIQRQGLLYNVKSRMCSVIDGRVPGPCYYCRRQACF